MRRTLALLSCAAGACTVNPDSAPATPPTISTSTMAGSIIDAGDPADAGADADATAAASTSCPADMVEVKGSFCTALLQKCLTRRLPWQCAEFEAPSRCTGTSREMHFCIDRYEWPNKKGELAKVLNTWRDAKASCEGIGKRLCTESEWTLACEGPDRLPFPYGYVRNAESCPIDKRSLKPDASRMNSLRLREAETARLDQREPSGAREKCVSAYGVHDLTGNVDEWVVNEYHSPFESALKGGNWGEFRNACRPATRAHDENWSYYQTGFRCCRATD